MIRFDNAKLKERQKFWQVKAFIPPQRAVEIARERTEGMVHYFWEVVRGMNIIGYMDCIDNLARSCYLQGIEDAAVAMAKEKNYEP